FKVARTADDLHALLEQRNRTPVLVDTAGRSPSDHAAKELFRVVGEAAGVRTHLVLPASTSVSAARRILDGYAEARPTRLVLTKVDEADSLSPLFSLLHERQVPISYLGTGQRVPEDLNRATAQLLAASVLGESKPSAHSQSSHRIRLRTLVLPSSPSPAARAASARPMWSSTWPSRWPGSAIASG